MGVHLRAELRRPELLLLAAGALLTRFWGLFNPRVVVWDEVHFERFAGAYLTGTSYADVHPPLGKMLLAGAARILGISGQSLLIHDPAPALRLLPALAGALIIPVVYLFVRGLGASRRTSTLAAALLMFDNALLVESRFILTDSMLILFGFAAVMFYAFARHHTGAPRWGYLAGAALAAGMAASVKWTGLSATGLILLAWCADAFAGRRRPADLITEASLLVAVPAAVYICAFAVHFALLGKADPYAGMPFLRAFATMNRDMQATNLAWATDTNPGASPWYTWPIAKHSIAFWAPTLNAAPDEPQRWIILFGNPMVWFGALAGMIAAAVAAFLRRAVFAEHRAVLLFLACGYLLNFVPFAFITRPMYLYHYFYALIFSVMLAALGAGMLMGWTDHDSLVFWRFPSQNSRGLYVGVIAAAAVAFIYLAPMSYGWPLSASQVLHRRWLLERRRLSLSP